MDFYRKQIITLIMGLSSLFVLQSCCNSQKLGDVMLTDEVKERIPYQETGRPVTMVDSAGNEIEFQITRGSRMMDDDWDCCTIGCCRPDYFEYEKEWVILKGDSTVKWHLALSQGVVGLDTAQRHPLISIEVFSPSSRNFFSYVSPKDSVYFSDYSSRQKYVGDLNLNGQTYKSVYRLMEQSYGYANEEESHGAFYNEQVGIIGVVLKNGERLSLQ